MPEFAKFLDFSSLFVALSGLLFATWYPQLDALLGKPLDPMYSNRKSYILGLQAAILSKAVPLFLFLLAYVVALMGVCWTVWTSTNFVLNPLEIDPPATLFGLTYALSMYLLIFSGVLLLRLIAAWWKAGADRGSKVRITVFR